ncbi:MAG: AAA family ATPase [Planctomycetota bacterium]|jgi:MoxR-like ATPase
MSDMSRTEAAELAERLRRELAKVIIGQEQVIDEILISLAAGGHVLLEGVPGLAKTLLISTLAQCTGLSFARIQFTPDLMPSDITGTEVMRDNKDSGERELLFRPGPIFASVILADEINRSPPKTQAAMLEAMQERQVSAGGEIRPLPAPFFVLATQNPIEQEGTYPLPEAQMDRFLVKVVVDYPTETDELAVILRTTGGSNDEPDAVVDAATLIQLQNLTRATAIPEGVARYALALVRASRPVASGGHEALAPLLRWGAGPRAGQALVLAAKARATLSGRTIVAISDIQAVAKPAMRHRLMASYQAEAEGLDAEGLVDRLVELVALPGPEAENDPALAAALR